MEGRALNGRYGILTLTSKFSMTVSFTAKRTLAKRL